MALIKCPECGKEISSFAEVCINCGYPIKKEKSNSLNKSSTEHNLQFKKLADFEILSQSEDSVLVECHNCNKVYTFRGIYFPKSELEYCTPTAAIICPNCNNGVDAGTKIKKKFLYNAKDENVVKCPRCGSTSIATGQRGYSLLWGVIGSNKTVNRCAKCGYSWKP